MQATIPSMDFGAALVSLRAGQAVRRKGWRSRGMLIRLDAGDPASGVLPSFSMRTATGQTQPGWLAAQNDMLAFDWEVA